MTTSWLWWKRTNTNSIRSSSPEIHSVWLFSAICGAGQHELIATGSVLSVNPDRIIAKRIVLSGHPFKINRKSAVIRYMFFTRGMLTMTEINWIKYQSFCAKKFWMWMIFALNEYNSVALLVEITINLSSLHRYNIFLCYQLIFITQILVATV